VGLLLVLILEPGDVDGSRRLTVGERSLSDGSAIDVLPA